jgi:hypothetical protein
MSNTDLLADYIDIEAFAAEVDRKPITVWRWTQQPNGLPYTKIGNRRLIHLPTAKAWIFSRMRKPNPRRSAHTPQPAA